MSILTAPRQQGSPPREFGSGRGANIFRRWLPTIILGVILGYLVVIPLALLVLGSFKPTGLLFDPGFTLRHYIELYGNPNTYVLLGTSAVFAFGSTLFALVLGAALAWLAERTDMPGRRPVRFLVILPMAMPPVLLAIGWGLLLSPRIGLINTALRDAFGIDQPLLNIYSMGGMIFVQAISMVPTAYLMLAPAFRNMDPALEEAALASGAKPFRVVTRVVLPLLWPSLLAAGAFILVVGFTVFDIPGILGMPVGIYVLSSEIYFQSSPPAGLPNYGGISALASVFLVILFALSWYYQRQTNRSQRYVTISGKASRARQFQLGAWKWVATGMVALYFIVGVFGPLIVLAWTSLLPYYAGFSTDMLSRLTLDNHVALASNPSVLGAAVNSIVVAVVAATVVTLLSAAISWVVVRSRARGRKVFDMLAFLPLAVPHTMIGLALIFVYLTFTAVPVYGTIWILVIAFVTCYISFGTRSTNSVLFQISGELEESAHTSGAGWMRTFREITLPLMRPALIAVWIWVAAHAMRELSAALMLQGRDNAVFPTLLWGYWDAGQATVAAAAGVWLIGALFVFVILTAVFGRKKKGDFR